jgi:hypothetical protein
MSLLTSTKKIPRRVGMKGKMKLSSTASYQSFGEQQEVTGKFQRVSLTRMRVIWRILVSMSSIKLFSYSENTMGCS